MTEPQARTLVYGRAGTDVRRIRVTVDGRDRDAPTGPGGTYLFVLAGRVGPTSLRPRPLYGP